MATTKARLTRNNRPVTSFVTRVHGMANEDLADKPTWAEIAGQVHTFMSTAWICAHNAHTDYRVLDTLRLAKATYPDQGKYSLDALIEHMRPDLSEAPAQRHRATLDAFATAQLLIAIASRYESWGRLVAAAVPPGLPSAPEPEKDPTLW